MTKYCQQDLPMYQQTDFCENLELMKNVLYLQQLISPMPLSNCIHVDIKGF